MIRTTLRGLLAATVLTVVVASAADAQASTPSRFGIKAGIALPMGDELFTDDAGLGLTIGGSFDVPLGQSKHNIRLEADYTRFSSESADSWSLLGGSALFVLNLNDMGAMSPYFLGGVGFHQWKVSDDPISIDDTALSFQGGVGYNFTLGSRKMFVEVRYLNVQSDGDNLPFNLAALPVTIGMKF